MSNTLARILYCAVPAVWAGAAAFVATFLLSDPPSPIPPAVFTGVVAAWAFGFGWAVTDPALERNR